MKDTVELKFTSNIKCTSKKITFGFNDATIKTFLVTPEKIESEKEALVANVTEPEELTAELTAPVGENRPGTYWNH